MWRHNAQNGCSLQQQCVWKESCPMKHSDTSVANRNVITMSPVLVGRNFSSVDILLTFMLCQCNVMTLLNNFSGTGAWSWREGCCSVQTQPTYDKIIASLLCQKDVATSFFLLLLRHWCPLEMPLSLGPISQLLSVNWEIIWLWLFGYYSEMVIIHCCCWELTHWGWGKMAAILQMTC